MVTQKRIKYLRVNLLRMCKTCFINENIKLDMSIKQERKEKRDICFRFSIFVLFFEAGSRYRLVLNSLYRLGWPLHSGAPALKPPEC